MLGDLSAFCASFLIFGDVSTAGALGIAPFYGEDAAALTIWNIIPMMYRGGSSLLCRYDVQSSIQVPVPVQSNNPSVTNHEQGLLAFARYLDAAMEHTGDAAIVAYQRLEKEYQQDLEAKIDVAKERFHLSCKVQGAT